MTSHTARLYALVCAILVFFVAWATAAAHPWPATVAAASDPRVAALQAREQRLRAESIAVKRTVDRRWALYRLQLDQRTRAIAAIRAQNTRIRAIAPAAAPSVRVITLPPLTITRTS